MYVPELLASRAAQTPDEVALLVDGERPLTFREWYERARSVAHALLRRGVAPGERVALVASGGEWIAYAVAYLGAKLAGAATLHLSDQLHVEELTRRMNQCGVRGVLHAKSTPSQPGPGWTLAVEDVWDTPAPGPIDVSLTGDTLAEIVYTSGTTGPAKPIAVTQAGLTHSLGRPERPRAPGFGIVAMPLGTSSAQGTVFAALSSHPPTAVVLSRLSPDLIGELAERLRAESVMMTPGTAHALVDSHVQEQFDVTSVRNVYLASALLSVPALRGLARTFPQATISNIYLSLESAPAFTLKQFEPWADHGDESRYTASLGGVWPGTEIRVVGGSGESLPPGEVGEIWLKSSAPPRSYYGDAQRTASTFRPDGWVAMGDLGHLSEDGELCLFDRAADAVTTPDGLVSTLAVEQALYAHPAVGEAAAFGVDGATMAAVVLKDAATSEEIKGFLRDRLKPNEVPAEIFVLDSFPRGSLGKVLKRELRRGFGG